MLPTGSRLMFISQLVGLYAEAREALGDGANPALSATLPQLSDSSDVNIFHGTLPPPHSHRAFPTTVDQNV